MPESRTLNKKQASLLDMVSAGWIPYQVTKLSDHFYHVNSGSTIGCVHSVRRNPVLGLTCSHEHGEYNDYHTCSHIRAVQSHLYSAEDYQSFDSEVHVKCYCKSLAATRTKKEWEWIITDCRGGAVGCMGVTVEKGKANWWTTYEGNHMATWDTCDQALEYLIAIVSF